MCPTNNKENYFQLENNIQSGQNCPKILPLFYWCLPSVNNCEVK